LCMMEEPQIFYVFVDYFLIFSGGPINNYTLAYIIR